METMLCSLHQATIGYQQARGSRWNMNQDMKRKPPYFDKAQEYYLDNETATPPPSREGTPESPKEFYPTYRVVTFEDTASHEVKSPTMLPPEYELLATENGITEEKRPVSAPWFGDCPDPSGRKPWLGIAVH